MSLKYVGETALQENIVKTKEHVESVRATLDAAKQDKIELATMPQASEDNLGLVVIYTGSTTSTYTHGYMYECVSDGETPATYSWEPLTSDVKIDNTTIIKDAYTGELSAALATTHSLGIVKGGTGTMIGDHGEVNVYQRLQEDYVGDPGSRVSVPYYDSKFRLNKEDNGNYKKGGIYELQINAVTPAGTENPSEEGWYEYNGTYGDDTEYVLSEDTTVDAQKTYYTIEWAIVSANAMTAGDGIDITGDVISSTAPEFVGTQAEWDLLSAAEKSHYLLVNITDSFDSENILYADMPIGTIVPFGGSGAPTMFLLCDGSEVAKATYPELYEVIGDAFGSASDATLFRLPDLRECVPVGAGKNITKSITNHDRYNLGQFKDDELGTHDHPLKTVTTATYNTAGVPVGVANNNTPTTATHGKQVGVNYIIKAKESGMPTDVTEGVRDVVSEMESYSTAETDTGKTWIDGKRIYRKVFTNVSLPTNSTWTTKIVDLEDYSIDTMVDLKYQATWNPETTNNSVGPIYPWFQLVYNKSTKAIGGYLGPAGSGFSYIAKHIIIEYTKTT